MFTYSLIFQTVLEDLKRKFQESINDSSTLQNEKAVLSEEIMEKEVEYHNRYAMTIN